jgi:hypothetical protein
MVSSESNNSREHNSSLDSIDYMIDLDEQTDSGDYVGDVLRQHGRQMRAMRQRHLDEEEEILLLLAAMEDDEDVAERIRRPRSAPTFRIRAMCWIGCVLKRQQVLTPAYSGVPCQSIRKRKCT